MATATETEFLHGRIQELSEAFHLLHHGLNQMLGVQAEHGEMLRQIVEAVSYEPDGESDITKLLRELVTIGDAHAQQQEVALSLLRQIKSATVG